MAWQVRDDEACTPWSATAYLMSLSGTQEVCDNARTASQTPTLSLSARVQDACGRFRKVADCVIFAAAERPVLLAVPPLFVFESPRRAGTASTVHLQHAAPGAGGQLAGEQDTREHHAGLHDVSRQRAMDFAALAHDVRLCPAAATFAPRNPKQPRIN